MRALLTVVCSWAVLLGAWQLYVGQTTRQTTIAGAIAAGIAVGFWILLGLLGLLRYRPRGRLLARSATLSWYVLRDFGIVTLALLRERPGGRFVEFDLPDGSAGDRALAGLLGSVAPNAYLVDFDTHRRRALVHELDPARSKGTLS
jgi:hypothetical protein